MQTNPDDDDGPGFFDDLIEKGKVWLGNQSTEEKIGYALGAALAIGVPLSITSAPESPQASVSQMSSVPMKEAVKVAQAPQPVKAAQPAPKPVVNTPPVVQRQPVQAESRLDSYLENVKQGYSQLGEQVKIGDQQVMEESRQQLEQAKAQKKAAEQALSAVREDKRRLEAERARLDTSLDDANKLYFQLAEQSKQQLANLKIQEKKAEEALAFVVTKRTQLETDKAKFNAAAQSANPSYLDDVQRQFEERENQVKMTYSLLEEESKKQLTKIQAREAAAEKALDRIVQEKEKLEIEKAQLGASLEEVNARYSLLIKQAELQLALVQAEEKVSEETLSAILHPQAAKIALQSTPAASSVPAPAAVAKPSTGAVQTPPPPAAAAPKPEVAKAAVPPVPKAVETPVSYTAPRNDAGFPVDCSVF